MSETSKRRRIFEENANLKENYESFYVSVLDMMTIKSALSSRSFQRSFECGYAK